LVIEALFGESGVILDKFLRKLNWVYIFRNFAGLFPYVSYNGVYLQDSSMNLHELNDYKEFPVHFGEHLIDFFCGVDEEEAEDTNSSSASATGIQDSSNHDNTIFANVIDTKSAKQALRLFLYARFVSRQGMYFLKFSIYILPVGYLYLKITYRKYIYCFFILSIIYIVYFLYVICRYYTARCGNTT